MKKLAILVPLVLFLASCQAINERLYRESQACSFSEAPYLSHYSDNSGQVQSHIICLPLDGGAGD